MSPQKEIMTKYQMGENCKSGEKRIYSSIERNKTGQPYRIKAEIVNELCKRLIFRRLCRRSEYSLFSFNFPNSCELLSVFVEI